MTSVNICSQVLDGTLGGLQSKKSGWIDKLQQYMPMLAEQAQLLLASNSVLLTHD